MYANPRKAVPLEPLAQPIALTIPKDGRLVPVPLRRSPVPPVDPEMMPAAASVRSEPIPGV